ncbi:MAG: hypothetical protein WBB45_09570 [Cyclobacteriaceae bacterium]
MRTLLSVLFLLYILFVTACNKSPQNITGHYTYLSKDSSVINTMNIHAIEKDQFFFELHSNVDQYAGYIEGYAEVKNQNTAVFYTASEFDTCSIEFHITENTIEFSEINGTCGRGLGADYFGKYKRVSKTPQEMPPH